MTSLFFRIKCNITKKYKIDFFFNLFLYFLQILNFTLGRSIMQKKGEGSQVKESTDSSTTLEDEDVKGKI